MIGAEVQPDGNAKAEHRARSWRSLAFVGVGFGVGAAIVLTLVGGVWVWYENRPTPWNEGALSVLSSEVTPTFSLDAKENFEFSGFELNYALQNNTTHDIVIPESVVIMERLAMGKTLRKINHAKPHSSYFVPGHQRAEYSLALDVSCATFAADNSLSERDPKVCFNDNFGKIDGFVLFDHTQRLEIFLPKPTFR